MVVKVINESQGATKLSNISNLKIEKKTPWYVQNFQTPIAFLFYDQVKNNDSGHSLFKSPSRTKKRYTTCTFVVVCWCLYLRIPYTIYYLFLRHFFYGQTGAPIGILVPHSIHVSSISLLIYHLKKKKKSMAVNIPTSPMDGIGLISQKYFLQDPLGTLVSFWSFPSFFSASSLDASPFVASKKHRYT